MEFEAIQNVARQYRDEGYEVIIEPVGDQKPPFAADFDIDLIATRAHEGVIAEVKRNRFDFSPVDRSARLAEITNAQPGWRFDLIILGLEDPIERVARGASEPSDDQLAESLKTAGTMVDAGYVPAACVIAWAGLEAAMRRIAGEAGSSRKLMPDELLRALYSNGPLTREQFETLRESFRIRSQVVHGLVPPRIDPEMVRYVIQTARDLLSRDEAAVPAS